MRPQTALIIPASCIATGLMGVVEAISWGYWDQLLEYFFAPFLFCGLILSIGSILSLKASHWTFPSSRSAWKLVWIAFPANAVLATALYSTVLAWIDEFLDEMYFYEIESPVVFAIFLFATYGLPFSAFCFATFAMLCKLLKVRIAI